MDVVNTQQPSPVANTQQPSAAAPPITKVGSGIDKILKIVDMREKCHMMQPLECKTNDNIDILVQGICFYEIFDPIKGVLSCEGQDVDRFIQTRALSLLRDAVESHNLITVMRKKQDLQNKMRVCCCWLFRFYN